MALELFKKLSNDLTTIFKNSDDYNVLIEVGQTPNRQTFKAHSVILNSRCDYFRKVLKKTTCDEDYVKNIKVTNIPVAIFEIIIKYIYNGDILFDKIDAPTTIHLLTAANELGLEELFNIIQNHLVKNHASWMCKNFVKVHKISLENDNFEELQQFCHNIIDNYPNIVFDSEDYLDLSENVLVSLLKLDNLNMDEGKIWDQVIKWGIGKNHDLDADPARWSDANFSTLKTTLRNCLPHIRYFHISSEDVIDKLYPYQKIVEPSLWKDILIKNLDVQNRSITSSILPPRVVQDDSALNNMRRKARECFDKGKFLEASKLYEKILANSLHSTDDLKNASIWDFTNGVNAYSEKELIILLYENTMLSSLKGFFDEPVALYADALCKNTTLTSLELIGEELYSEDVIALANALCKNVTLSSLKLTHFVIESPKDAKVLFNVLCKNTTLTSFNLESSPYFEGYFSTEKLREFEENGNNIDGLYNEFILGEIFADALYKNTTLTSLNLNNTKLGVGGGKSLAKVLCNNTTLTSLNIGNNDLGLEVAKTFADILCTNTTLTYLNLKNILVQNACYEDDDYDNDFGSEIGKLIADALCKNTTLTFLNISSNYLGSGGKAIADALCKNTTLNSLDMSVNGLGPDEGKAIADALCKNTTLASLNICNNKIGSEGGNAFAEAICKNTTLTSLDLKNNQLGSKDVETIEEALSKNTTLTDCNLKSNDEN
ncbi:hypothetical protein C2G38_2245063 [Gigaspora rosea]|uniref:BTB domain-containing protein n=1 Tax=Gigaspora rosea TaxID=44941 RepID=A0A397VAS7_9GLOM|nr:hypothetical protein C2G38_2245063 [Gigaspora rosea]